MQPPSASHAPVERTPSGRSRVPAAAAAAAADAQAQAVSLSAPITRRVGFGEGSATTPEGAGLRPQPSMEPHRQSKYDLRTREAGGGAEVLELSEPADAPQQHSPGDGRQRLQAPQATSSADAASAEPPGDTRHSLRVQRLDELDADFGAASWRPHMAAPQGAAALDLSLLTGYLCPSDQVEEPDEVWQFDQLLAAVKAQLSKREEGAQPEEAAAAGSAAL